MLNEFRQDPVSGDWVLFATGRNKKPGARQNIKLYQSKEECLFEPERLSAQESPIVIYNGREIVTDFLGDWSVIVIPNKYPSVQKNNNSTPSSEDAVLAVGSHELVFTRDHDKHFAHFTDQETAAIIRAYLDRYRALSSDAATKQVLIFHNHGSLAGATNYHNHSQIISMPIIPARIERHFIRSRQYLEKEGTNMHEVLLAGEQHYQKRVVFENEHFVIICPYASKKAYEMKIFPKNRSAYFGKLPDDEVPALAEALNVALKKLSNALEDPDYNFFIHTAPEHESALHDAYHWHIEIMPQLSIIGGQEVGIDVTVNTVDPDEAAELLRNTTI